MKGCPVSLVIVLGIESVMRKFLILIRRDNIKKTQSAEVQRMKLFDDTDEDYKGPFMVWSRNHRWAISQIIENSN